MIGLIGKKIGMTQVFDDDGVLIPVTVVHFEPNVIVGCRSAEKHGYEAVVIGAIECLDKRVNQPLRGQFKQGIKPRKCLVEVRNFARDCKIGDEFGVEIFEGFRFVDVMGTSKGKGFQGVMKRHNFAGGRASHGSKFHRANGSTGMAAWPSRVIKGTKMPGNMGNVASTILNLRIVKIDSDKRVLLIKGAVPGNKNGIVFVRESSKLK